MDKFVFDNFEFTANLFAKAVQFTEAAVRTCSSKQVFCKFQGKNSCWSLFENIYRPVGLQKSLSGSLSRFFSTILKWFPLFLIYSTDSSLRIIRKDCWLSDALSVGKFSWYAVIVIIKQKY